MSATQRPQRKNTGFSTALQAMLKTQPMHADSNVASQAIPTARLSSALRFQHYQWLVLERDDGTISAIAKLKDGSTATPATDEGHPLSWESLQQALDFLRSLNVFNVRISVFLSKKGPSL